MNAAEFETSLKAVLEHEPRVNLHSGQLEVQLEEGVATLAGELATIAAKRLTLEAAAVVPGVVGIVDRLRVRAAEQMGDGAIADHLTHSLMRESSFAGYEIRKQIGGTRTVTRSAETEMGQYYIEIFVDDGVVTLDGDVGSLSHKRLAGALAWWVPGSRDVINGLGVEPPEADNDAEILDALRLVHEKDPLLDATQVRAACERSVVTLEGLVTSEEQKELAEDDAWALFAVDNVINRIGVHRV